MIRQRLLTPGNEVPRLAHALRLAPREKIRLVLRTPQAVYRIKNCCGELYGSLDVHLCFSLRNRDGEKDFDVGAGAKLTEILNHPQITTTTTTTSSVPSAAASTEARAAPVHRPVRTTWRRRRRRTRTRRRRMSFSRAALAKRSRYRCGPCRRSNTRPARAPSSSSSSRLLSCCACRGMSLDRFVTPGSSGIWFFRA